MKATRALLILLASTPSSLMAEEGKTERMKSTGSIEVQPSRPQFVLGRAIDLRVVYSSSSGEPWKLERPESSAGVKVHYERVDKGDPSRMAFSFSRMTSKAVRLPDGTTQIVYTAPPRTEIEVPPGGKHELTADIYSRWTEDLAPGEYEAWVEDAGQKLTSNRCRFSLAFTRESVPLLLAAAAAETESAAKRKWCAGWLEKVQRGFVLKLPAAGDSPAALQAASAHNAQAIEAFRRHWDEIKGSREIDARFSEAAAQASPERKRPELPRKVVR